MKNDGSCILNVKISAYESQSQRKGEKISGNDWQKNGARNGKRLKEQVRHENASKDLKGNVTSTL